MLPKCIYFVFCIVLTDGIVQLLDSIPAVRAYAVVADTAYPDRPHPDDNNNNNMERQLRVASEALCRAGELTSDMASKLPNWYSSKEGLTGESPAVFGAGGMALSQAGQSLQWQLQKQPQQQQQPDLATALGVLQRLRSCASDLAHAACHFEPVHLHSYLDEACTALHEVVSLESAEMTNVADAANNAVDRLLDVETALAGCGRQFQEYGALLLAEEHETAGESSAGSMLSAAGQQLELAGLALASISVEELIQCLQQEQKAIT